MRNKEYKYAFLILFLLVSAIFSGCNFQDTTEAPSELFIDNQSTYEIDDLIKGTDDLYIGTLNPGTEMPQKAFFQYAGYNKYRLVAVVPWSQSGFPQYEVYQDYLYYFGESASQIYALDIKNPDEQINITPPSLENSSDRYRFTDLITIKDNWIYLEAKKYGTREDGGESYLLGYYLAIYTNGEDWKEITEEELPKEKDGLP